MLASLVSVYLRENYRNIKKAILWKNLVLKLKHTCNITTKVSITAVRKFIISYMYFLHS